MVSTKVLNFTLISKLFSKKLLTVQGCSKVGIFYYFNGFDISMQFGVFHIHKCKKLK
jgi:hypothetical protein